jgi:hypothetical protein
VWATDAAALIIEVRMIELDRLKMEKISKEREGAWDWGERVEKVSRAVSRF